MKPRTSLSRTKRKVPPGQRQDQAQKKENSQSYFPIVGIGASAGGLEAFTRLLRHLPPDSGMAFLLVQHLDPKHESRLAEILACKTSMPVTEVKDGMPVAPSHVYIIPPKTNMSIRHGALHLEPRNDSTIPHLPVNFLFRSLAKEQKGKAIGVILSGAASDGVEGMKAIKAEGGVTFAQDEGSAKHFGMPQSSIAAGVVDFIRAPEEIATDLAKMARHPHLKPREVEKAQPANFRGEGERAHDELFRLLTTNFAVDFSGYKFSTINRRIKRRMVLCSIGNLEKYLKYVRKNRGELERLYQDMFVGVTRFFREPETFKALQRLVFPHIRKQVSSGSPIRIWVPGCSTGEEVYSIAISLLEYLGDRGGSTPIQIFGSDINEEAVKKARQGKYVEDIAADVGPARLQRFFVKVPEGYQVSKVIRDLCIFARHDLMRDTPFSRVDLLSCRNVLIYLGSGLHRKLFPVFHYALKPSGFLLLGTAETIGEFSGLFNLVDRKHKIYAKKSATVRLPIDFGAQYLSKPALAQGREKLSGPGTDVNLERNAADLLVLNEYAPASVLVNERMEILHFRGHTGAYLEPAPGAASLNLLKMAREGLVVGLRTAFHAARKKGSAAHAISNRLDIDDREKTIHLHVVPVKAPGIKDRTFLVVFEDVTGAAAPGLAENTARRGKGVHQAKRDERVSQLKQELATTKAYLQSVAENQEASNEELRSLNEEIMSSNEELQSTTEELETSNEELQSGNEELITLNEELQNRNQELSQANNDILNLLTSMNLSVLLLDRSLRIRHFTPTAQKVLHIAASDLGRPLTKIQLPLVTPDLERHIVETMDNLKPMQAEVQGQDGRWYTLQIHPYITDKNHLEGAVVALTDISQLATLTAELVVAGEDLQREQGKRTGAEEAVRAGVERFRVVADSLREAVADIDADQRCRFTNAAFNKWFGLTSEQDDGHSVRELMGEEIYGTIQPYIDKVLLGQSGSFVGYLSHKGAGRRYVQIDLVPRTDEGGKVYGFYTMLRDLTELKEAEERPHKMARDVHDTLAQGFTGIILNLDTAEEGCANLPEEVRNRIGRARDVARASLEEARRSVLASSSSLPVGGSLVGSLRGLVDRYRPSTMTHLDFSVQGTAVRLDPAIEENLLRIAQQATDNVLQHAHAKFLRMELAFDETMVQLTITDDGQGFDVKKTGRGVGLTSMRERAEEIGGKCELKSQAGKGTSVEVRAPLSRAASQAAF